VTTSGERRAALQTLAAALLAGRQQADTVGAPAVLARAKVRRD